MAAMYRDRTRRGHCCIDSPGQDQTIIRTQQVRDPVTGALSTSLTGRVPAGQRRLSQGP
jgi:hypothetical protein